MCASYVVKKDKLGKMYIHISLIFIWWFVKMLDKNSVLKEVANTATDVGEQHRRYHELLIWLYESFTLGSIICIAIITYSDSNI